MSLNPHWLALPVTRYTYQGLSPLGKNLLWAALTLMVFFGVFPTLRSFTFIWLWATLWLLAMQYFVWNSRRIEVRGHFVTCFSNDSVIVHEDMREIVSIEHIQSRLGNTPRWVATFSNGKVLRLEPHLANCDQLIETFLTEQSQSPTACFTPKSSTKQLGKNRELSS